MSHISDEEAADIFISSSAARRIDGAPQYRTHGHAADRFTIIKKGRSELRNDDSDVILFYFFMIINGLSWMI